MSVGSFDVKETDPVLRSRVLGRSDMVFLLFNIRPFLNCKELLDLLYLRSQCSAPPAPPRAALPSNTTDPFRCSSAWKGRNRFN